MVWLDAQYQYDMCGDREWFGSAQIGMQRHAQALK